MLNKSIKSLIEDTHDEVAILANSAALLYELLPDVNWVGFYLFKNNKLILGPFQGKPACVDIEIGKGACGTAAKTLKPVILKDVNKIDNYIACHPETNSEIVLPMTLNGNLYGVLDIDSTTIGRFTLEDQKLLTESVDIITKKLLSI